MKTLLRLVQNELIKVFRQISWKILIALLLIAAAAVPPLLKSLLPTYRERVTDNQAYYDSIAEEYEASEKSTVEGQYLKSRMELYKFVLDNNAVTDGWKSSIFWELERYYNTEKALELIDQGKSPEEVLSKGGNTLLELRRDGQEIFFLKEIDRIPSDRSNGRHFMTWTSNDFTRYYEYVPVNTGDVSAYKESVRRSAEKYKKLLLADKVEYADLVLKDLDKKINSLQSDIKNLENEYKKDSAKMGDYYSAQNQLIALNAQRQALEKFKTSSPENENWIFKSIQTLGSDAINYQSYVPKNKESFKTLSGDYDFSLQMGGNRLMTFNTYEEYLAFISDKREDYKAAVQTLLYSVQHEIPTDFDNVEIIRLRKSAQWSFTADLYLVMFLSIFLASTIMSSEYSSGSIRLLLIRPVSRWKILLSKLLTVVIFCIGSLALSFTITALSSQIAIGGKIFTMPYLTASSSGVTEISPLLYIIKNALIDGTSMFLAVILGFVLSLIIKRGVVSVAVGIAIFAFGQLIANISMYVVGYAGIVRYTLIPYLMNMQSIRYELIEHVLNNGAYFSDAGIFLGMGLTVVAIHTLLLIALSFWVFNKQQVKN